jgi:hypothetical protein
MLLMSIVYMSPITSRILATIILLADRLLCALDLVFVPLGRTQYDFALSVAIRDGKRLEYDVVSIS